MPVSSYSSARLTKGSSSASVALLGDVPVNFSGQAVDGAPSTFTIGGWVRLLSTPLPGTQTVFLAQYDYDPPQAAFSLTISTDGFLTAGFGVGTVPSVTADIAILDSGWHYVAASYLQSPTQPLQGGQGALQIYIDGFQAGVGEVDSVSLPADDAQLGVSASDLDFASWSVWATAVSSDVIDVPEWGASPPGSEAASDLVAAFDFASGTAIDQSGTNRVVTVAQQYWHTPCLQINPGGFATPDSADPLDPGGPAAFSLLGWVRAPTGGGGSYTVVRNGTPSAMFAVTIANSGPGQVLEVTRTGVTSPSVPVASPGEWTHIAVTYDQSNLCVYVGGSLQSTTPVVPNSLVAITPQVIFGGPEAEASWSLQGLSVWSTALDAPDIANYMGDADPTGADGCVVYYALMVDLGNTTRNTALTATNAGIGELDSPLTPTSPAAVAAGMPAPAGGDFALLTVGDYKALATKLGIDVSSPLDPETASSAIAEAMAWYEMLLGDLPPSAAARLREHFGRNLRIGIELAAQGNRTGSFEVSEQAGRAVVYFHTEEGRQEVGRLDIAPDPHLMWCAQIFFDVLSIVAAMFGILTTAAKVTGAVGLVDDLFPAVGAAAQAAQGQTNIARACSAIFAVLKVLWEWKAIFSLVKKIITASWWSLVFTALSLAAQIVALVTSGGWLIAWKVAQMAIAIGQLVYDLENPKTVAPALTA